MNQKRRAILLGALVFGCVWQLTGIVEDTAPDGQALAHPWQVAVLIVNLAGYAGWGVCLFRLVGWVKRLRRDPALAAAVGDEFYQQVRLKALAAGLAAVLACQGCLIAVSLFHALTARVGADATIFAATTASLAVFLWLERP